MITTRKIPAANNKNLSLTGSLRQPVLSEKYRQQIIRFWSVPVCTSSALPIFKKACYVRC